MDKLNTTVSTTKRAYSHSTSSRPGRPLSSSNYRSSQQTRCKSGQRENVASKTNKRLGAQTVWARQCVKKHTRRCQGHFRLHACSREEKEDTSVKDELKTEQLANESGKISNDKLKQLSVNTVTSCDNSRTSSEVKSSPFSSSSHVSITCFRLQKLKHLLTYHYIVVVVRPEQLVHCTRASVQK